MLTLAASVQLGAFVPWWMWPLCCLSVDTFLLGDVCLIILGKGIVSFALGNQKLLWRLFCLCHFSKLVTEIDRKQQPHRVNHILTDTWLCFHFWSSVSSGISQRKGEVISGTKKHGQIVLSMSDISIVMFVRWLTFLWGGNKSPLWHAAFTLNTHRKKAPDSPPPFPPFDLTPNIVTSWNRSVFPTCSYCL